MTQPIPIGYQMGIDPNQWITDQAHLKALAICHYVWGGLIMLFSCMFIFHIVMVILTLNGSGLFAGPNNGPPPPREFGWFFIAGGSCAITIGWLTGILTILSGRYIQQQRKRVFSLVVAGVNCISFPIGT